MSFRVFNFLLKVKFWWNFVKFGAPTSRRNVGPIGAWQYIWEFFILYGVPQLRCQVLPTNQNKLSPTQYCLASPIYLSVVGVVGAFVFLFWVSVCNFCVCKITEPTTIEGNIEIPMLVALMPWPPHKHAAPAVEHNGVLQSIKGAKISHKSAWRLILWYWHVYRYIGLHSKKIHTLNLEEKSVGSFFLACSNF